MKGKSPGPPPIYAESLKITVAREYLTTDQSCSQLARKYGLNKGDVVKSMVSWYKRHYSLDQLPTGKQEFVSPSVAAPAESAVSTDKDKQLKEALLKVEALELLIANAQKELGVDLIKKLGTKQPGR
jgi:transposase-like protein